MSKIVHTNIWVTNSPNTIYKCELFEVSRRRNYHCSNLFCITKFIRMLLYYVCIVNFFEFPRYTFAQQNIVNNCKIYQWPTSKS